MLGSLTIVIPHHKHFMPVYPYLAINYGRPVHGSVRFEPQKPTELSNSNFFKIQIEPNRIPVQTEPIRFG